MSMPITIAFLSDARNENLPASAPISIMVQICDGLNDLKMKSVSIRVRYLPMRVLAAFSQCVSSERFFSILASEVSSTLITTKFYFMGLTSTSKGIKDSFLPHLGLFPSYCCKTSSGGLSSAPSYNMCLQSLQMTRCGTSFHFRNNRSNLCDIFIGY